jgi:hypothetical protein
MRCHPVGCGMDNQMRPSNAIDHAQHYSRSHDGVIRVYDTDGNVIAMHQHKGRFQNVARSGSTYRVSVSHPNTRSLQPVFEEKIRSTS